MFNWYRGFIRLWAVLSCIWIYWVLSGNLDVSRTIYFWREPDWKTVAWWKVLPEVEFKLLWEAASIAIGGPLVLLGVAMVIAWILQGFRKKQKLGETKR